MKTRTTRVRDLKPGQRYFAGSQTYAPHYRGGKRPRPHAVFEVAARHALMPSEHYIEQPGLVLIWRDEARPSTGFDVYPPDATVEVIVEDPRMTPDVLVKLADAEWIDIMLWHYAGDPQHGTIEQVEHHRSYLHFVEARLEHIRNTPQRRTA